MNFLALIKSEKKWSLFALNIIHTLEYVHKCTCILLHDLLIEHVYTYFMLIESVVQNIFPEEHVPTWSVIAQGEVPGENRLALLPSFTKLHLCPGQQNMTICLGEE